MLVIDDLQVDMWPEEREKFHPAEVQANETFVEVAEHVRDVVGDDDLYYVAWAAQTAGAWAFGLFELLCYCNAAGAVVPDELLDRCLESDFDEDRPIARKVEELRARARAREAASG